MSTIKQFLNVPLYTYRVFCEGGHVFKALLPEKDDASAFDFVKTCFPSFWLFTDQQNKVKSAVVESSKIVAIDALSKDPLLIEDRNGVLVASVFNGNSKPAQDPPKRVGRSIRRDR